jgi:hypothetical protein
VAHPAGMQLLSKYLLKNIIDGEIVIESDLHTTNTAQSTNGNTTYSSNVFYGNTPAFLTRANVGDLFVINTTETAEFKRYTRVITNVVNDNTLWLENPIGGLGDGRLRITSGNPDVVVYANSSPIGESLENGDNISFNISGTVYNRYVSANSGNVLTLNASVSATGNVLYLKNPTYNVVSYTIIKNNG